MFALFQVIALCVGTVAPGYTIHVRDLTAPEQVTRVKPTGSETVLDAVERLQLSSRELRGMDLWLARRDANGKVQFLPVDWVGITRHGLTATNYQVLTGDRLFVQARPIK
jgi:polysaccharide biosynthesis/export protein